ncbi:MAG: alpha-amylase family protein [Cyclobacteriaceae bacterium]|nr:alpha-amylase family protein [Cyclobacteriaceae bacterium]
MIRISLLSLIILFDACSRTTEKIPDVLPVAEPKQKVVIYQMMTRLFGNKVNTNKKYGTIAENGVGKFNDINEAALKELKEMGITYIWFTGIIEHALLTDYTAYGIPLDDADVVKGRAGSPYSIKDYYDVNPDLAIQVPNRMKEFEALVERTHAHGLKVIIDFVPNHVARNYKSDAKPRGVRDFGEDDDKTVPFKPSNNFYYLPGQNFKVPEGYIPLGPENEFPTKDGVFDENPAKATGNDKFVAQPAMTDWFEAAKLNYGVDIQGGGQKHFDPVPDTWIKMRDILLFWTSKKVDGFRCDIAEMVPVEFWNWVIPQVKAVNTDLIFIAEIYNPSLYRNFIQTGRFDFLYDKVQLYDTLRKLIRGEGSTSEIHSIQESLSGINKHMLHFLENHDEQRIASKYFAGDPWKAVPAMVISATIDSGPVMIYFGQEVGEPANGDPGHQTLEQPGTTTKMDYWGVPEHQKWMNNGLFDGGLLSEEQKQLRQFYADLLNIAGQSEAIAWGNYADLTQYNLQQKQLGDDIHAFVRWHDDERLLIVSSFRSKPADVTITIPEVVAAQMGLQKGNAYVARDILWREIETGIDENLSVRVRLNAYGALILKIK